MKKIILTIVFSWLFVITTLADELAFNVKTLKKEKKELMKQIKKQYECKKVIPVVSDDGSYYYFLLKGKREYGVADYNGNIIVPIEYDDVTYLPPVEEGVSKVPCRDGHSRKKVIIEGKYAEVYHKKAAASFFASNDTGSVYIDAKTGDTVDEYVEGNRIVIMYTGSFYNLSGKKTASHKLGYPCVSIIPGLVVVDRFLTSEPMYGDNYRKIRHEDSYKSMSIFYNDGTPIAENIKYFNFIANDEIEYKKNVDGITRVGRYDLRNPQESIPCNYLEIKTMDNIVYVKQSALDEFVPYSAELGALGITYRDEGEKLFNQEKWDDVINYYANNGIDAPWGSYISAEALYQKAEEIAERIMIAIGHYDNNPSNTLYRYDDKSHNPRNLEVANECHKTAHKLNSMYLSGSDTIYLKNACVLQEKLNENIAQFAVNKAKYAQVLKNTQAEIDAQKAQQRQMVLSILSATLDVLSQAASNSQSSYSTSQSSYNKSGTVYNTNNSSNNKATTEKQSSTSEQDNSGRKAFLRGEIITWKNKLKQAEESLQKSIDYYAELKLRGDGDAWRVKDVVDSKRKTVETCKEMIRKYEAELNSLQ